MKIFLTALFSLFFLSSISQLKNNSIAVEGGGAMAINIFAGDSLVPTKRQGKTGIGEDAYVNAYFLFSFRNPKLKYKVGVGYAERNFGVNKYSLDDFIAVFFLFDSPYRRDTFHLQNVQLHDQYLNIPVGISYRLSKGRTKVCEVYTGIQFNPAILISSRVKVNFDSTYFIPTTVQKQAVEKKYSHTSGSLFVTVQPRLDLRFRVYHGLGLDMTLFPFLFYLNSSNKKLISHSFGFAGFLGVHYDF